VTVVASSLRTPLSLDPNIGGLAVSGGTLFVDGLEELSLEGQAELLAELDHGVLRDVRLVCSVRTDPPSLVARGVLSRALHHELRAATISLPPLRDRIDRVAVAERMLGDIAPGVAMSAAARAVIERYRFPGNLLELEGALERASALALDDRVLEVEHLPEEMLGLAPDARSEGGLAATAERAVVEEAVKGAGGNMTVAARRLGVARSTLYRMMERHGVLRS
jgi:transcriptional regulator of acetoin/glycerol metabolism